jgi:GDP-mannose 6-dehydrogenase
MTMEKISIFGLGYVGTVMAACLVRDGHRVTGVDPNTTKVDIINQGRSPIIEKDLESLIAEGVRSGRLRATADGRAAILDSDISFVCVGTPSNPNGSLDLRWIERVVSEIAESLAGKAGRHVVAIRSTVLPGTAETTVLPIMERVSGRKAGRDFGLVANPEFLRESSAVEDFYDPPKTVIGASEAGDADRVAALYAGLPGPLVKTSLKVAEMIKYTDNAFHALKVVFANEIGNICKALGVDSHEVMDIFSRDVKLNLSPYYLKPGFAFGGSCLPKEVRALLHKAKTLDVDVPMLKSLLESNELQVKLAVRRIMQLGRKKIAVLGFAFKAGTDDLRESPIVDLIEVLLGKGYDIRIFDRQVALAKLFGANREFIEKRIPHIAELMVNDLESAVEGAEVIVIGNKSEEFREILPRLGTEQYVLDLVRISDSVRTSAHYEGICW